MGEASIVDPPKEPHLGELNICGLLGHCSFEHVLGPGSSKTPPTKHNISLFLFAPVCTNQDNMQEHANGQKDWAPCSDASYASSHVRWCT